MTTDIICPHCGISRAHENLCISRDIRNYSVTDENSYVMQCTVCGSRVLMTAPPV